MKIAISWLVNQLKQPSTWRGVVMLATSAGIAINPDLIEHIIVVGTATAGAIGVLFKG